MSDDVETFRLNLLETARAHAQVARTYLRDAFLQEIAARLIVAEELPDFTPCLYVGRGRRRRELVIDGYAIDDVELDNSISVVVADFRETAEAPHITQAQLKGAIDKGIHFIEESLEGRLHETLEPSTPASDLANWLFDHRSSVNSVKLFLVTDGVLSDRIKEVAARQIGNIRIDLHVWDVVRFMRAEGFGGREPIEIDLKSIATALPALRASIGEGSYASYLCVVRGDILADLYDRYGARLLESNVRSFLSARVKVNAGIQSTILNAPSRFFAYNNGLTATASRVETEDGSEGLHIVKIHDLQIVNGGQTTASLFHARRRGESAQNLHQVFVQMKLSEMTTDDGGEFVSKVARYANTQNKVSDADFFSNHPFHLRLGDLSQRLWAPAVSGTQHQTHWFYERARGQYSNELLKLTPARRRTFELQNPKSQLIVKTDLAKFENSWGRRPDLVSRGAQKNFIAFADTISERWTQAESDFNEKWFQDAVAKAIVFRATERLVSEQTWYDGGYRANIVTYAIARTVDEVTKRRKAVDLGDIWKRQRITPAFELQLVEAAKVAHDVILSPPPGKKNASEWAKAPECWDRVRNSPLFWVASFQEELVADSDVVTERSDARRVQREDASIDAQKFVLGQGPSFWQRVVEWNQRNRKLTAKELSIVVLAARPGRATLLTPAQAIVLKQMCDRLGTDLPAG